MTRTSLLRSAYLSHISKPSSDRPVYRAIRRYRIGNIVELGIGLGRRAVRMIEVASWAAGPCEVRYTGIDLFEDRAPADGPGMTLKMAHRLLKRTGARVTLVPGDPFSALARTANSLGGTGLVVISERQDPASLARAWFYFPRMLGPESLVLIEERLGPQGKLAMRRIGPEEIARLAAVGTGRRAA